MFSLSNLPREYASFLLEDGVVERIRGGARGRAVFAWNNEFTPSFELAERLVVRYNSLRNQSYKKLKNIAKSNSREIADTLSEIKALLQEIHNNTKPVVKVEMQN